MKFSIITPSFRQLGWLKRCARSIADQQGVEVEHIIQDAGTGPELDAWVSENTKARLFVEKDAGMYDAVNRGMERACGDILGYLNCDEQYLPGALQAVAAAFEEDPDLDILVGDFLIVDERSKLLCFRRVPPLRLVYMGGPLYAYTCATFYRRRVWESGLRFRTDLKIVADGRWMVDALKKGFRSNVLRRYLAAFTHTGENLSNTDRAEREISDYKASLPWWQRTFSPVFRTALRVERFLAGGYCTQPITYDVYATDDATTRSRFLAEHPRGAFPKATE